MNLYVEWPSVYFLRSGNKSNTIKLLLNRRHGVGDSCSVLFINASCWAKRLSSISMEIVKFLLFCDGGLLSVAVFAAEAYDEGI